MPGDGVAVSLGNENWAEITVGAPYRTGNRFTDFSFSCFLLPVENTYCTEDRDMESLGNYCCARELFCSGGVQFPRKMSNIAINVLPSCDGYCLYLETSELVLEYKSRSFLLVQ